MKWTVRESINALRMVFSHTWESTFRFVRIESGYDTSQITIKTDWRNSVSASFKSASSALRRSNKSAYDVVFIFTFRLFPLSLISLFYRITPWRTIRRRRQSSVTISNFAFLRSFVVSLLFSHFCYRCAYGARTCTTTEMNLIRTFSCCQSDMKMGDICRTKIDKNQCERVKRKNFCKLLAMWRFGDNAAEMRGAARAETKSNGKIVLCMSQFSHGPTANVCRTHFHFYRTCLWLHLACDGTTNGWTQKVERIITDIICSIRNCDIDSLWRETKSSSLSFSM